MYNQQVRDSLEASLPPGIFWTSQNDFSLILDALAERLTPFYVRALNTANIRDPETSDRILDLADEFGAEFFSDIGLDAIRALVQLAKKGVTEPGAGDLQAALNAAGFPVQVHSNAPKPTNPANFIGDSIPMMVAGNINSVANNERAQAAVFPGAPLLVNGLIAATVPVYLGGAGVNFMVAGNQKAVAGYFEDTQEVSFGSRLPENPDCWNSVYFIGGDATRTIDGELLTIDYVDIPQTRQTEFENLILKYGLADGWVGLFINYT